MNPWHKLFAAALALAAALSSAPALAQEPPVRIVVPFAPAGAADILGRIVAERLTAAGRTAIVENKPGASGHLGAQLVAKAPGDGATLLVGTIGIHAAYMAYRHLSYDPARDLQPIMILGESPNVVLVPADAPYRTFGDFLADAKAHPGKVSYASAGRVRRCTWSRPCSNWPAASA
jgi:tripartite-type tricarboxylate transporter receptor subunit TctC